MSIAYEFAPPGASSDGDHLKQNYLQTLRLIERLHRLLLDVIKDEFERKSETEVNSVQALLLYNIGDAELTAGELRSRGYYLGSNVSYNLKKLVDAGFIDQKRSETDGRSVRIKLSERGQQIRTIIDGLYCRQLESVEAVGEMGSDEFSRLGMSLMRLERFWTDQIRYRL